MMKKRLTLLLAAAVLAAVPALSQSRFNRGDLDRLVGRIALYPDPLLAQVLTASTYSNDVPAAEAWAHQHSRLSGDALARSIDNDRLPWDPSVLALLPFPSVLEMMARDPGWTEDLGNAVLSQRAEVMDAVQRMRHKAMEYGYLRPGPQYRIQGREIVEIIPTGTDFFVPVYDPLIVYAPPRPGFFVGGAITFGPRIFLGAAFAPWGWRNPGFGWREHAIMIDNHVWERTVVNRTTYVHNYAAPAPRRVEGARVERHEVQEHREHERAERGHWRR